MFDETKLAQAAAYLVSKRSNGPTSHQALIKLLYLADREALRRFDAPISGDNYFAMPDGPVLSRALDLMNGSVQPASEDWSSWLSQCGNDEVAVIRDVSRQALDHLSDADIGVLDAVTDQYGHLSHRELQDLLQDHHQFPEWEDPHGSSESIPLTRILVALGKDLETAEEIRRNLEGLGAIDAAFVRL